VNPSGAAAGCEVAQVDGQGLVAEPLREHRAQEVAGFHQHVGRGGQLHARLQVQQGAIVAHAQCRAPGGPGEIGLDQFEFTEGHAALSPSVPPDQGKSQAVRCVCGLCKPRLLTQCWAVASPRDRRSNKHPLSRKETE